MVAVVAMGCGGGEGEVGGSLGATTPPPARTPPACAAAGVKGHVRSRAVVAEEGRDGEAERSLAPEESPTW
jgi:hypothetical protein